MGRIEWATLTRRVLWGVDRPPAGVAWDNPRLPGLTLGPAPLRLNTLPVPPALVDGGTERASRPGAVLAWLQAGCGEYARPRRRFMADYLAWAARAVAGPALDARVARFAGLFAPEDWAWSVLRPLPRAWLAGPDGPMGADILFWDGRQPLAVLLGDGNEAALAAAGAACVRLRPGQALDDALPPAVQDAWQGDTLPASPFRRALDAAC